MLHATEQQRGNCNLNCKSADGYCAPMLANAKALHTYAHTNCNLTLAACSAQLVNQATKQERNNGGATLDELLRPHTKPTSEINQRQVAQHNFGRNILAAKQAIWCRKGNAYAWEFAYATAGGPPTVNYADAFCSTYVCTFIYLYMLHIHMYNTCIWLQKQGYLKHCYVLTFLAYF